MESEIPPTSPIRLKVEINCKEHFTELGFVKIPFEVNNSWFTGKCDITTYELDELLGTKLRALYQRKKGRDLFDMYKAISQDINIERIIQCYKRYMDFVVDAPPTYKQFILNMESKIQDPEFIGDTQNLLRAGEKFEEEETLQAYEVVREMFIERLR